MKIQKRLAGQLLNASPKRVKFDNERLMDISEAITKTDIRQLIREGAIVKEQEKGISRGRARKIQSQKSKGRRKGKGSHKGTKTAREPRKETWMNKIRSQRELIANYKEKGNITKETARDLYKKAGGGFFRSKRHINIFIDDHNLFIKVAQEKITKTPKPKKETKTSKKTTKKTTTKKSESPEAKK